MTEWRILRDGDGSVVVAVDFESGQPEPGLPDLVNRLRTPATIVAPRPSVSASTAGEWVAACCRFLDEHGWQVRGVLGYCAGAALACALAADLADSGSRPAVLLFDPEPIRPEVLFYQYMRATERYEDHVDPDRFDEAVERVMAACRTLPMAGMVGELSATFREISRLAFDEMDLDPDLADEIADRFAAYLAFLSAAADAGYGQSTDEVVTLLSQDYTMPAGLLGEIRKSDASHDDLLTGPETVAMTDRELMS